MKIVKVEAIPVRQKGEIKEINDSAQDGIIVRVTTDEGIVGYGEVDSAPWVIKAIIDSPVSHRTCQGLKNVVIGRDPFDYKKIWDDMYLHCNFYGNHGAAIQAMSGIDIAIWDILGKALGKPIWQLLGGKYRDKVRAYASVLMPYTEEEAKEEALKWKAKGYTAIKMGWGGFEQDLATEVKLCKAAREAVGDDVDLLFDIGYIPSDKVTIDVASRIQLVKAIEQYRPYAVEEALWPHDYLGYKRLQESTSVRIVCGENETTRFGFKQLIDYCKLGVVQPDITRCGGITEAMRIANYAEVNAINVVPHCWSSGIVEAASLQIIAAIPNAEILEYCEQDTPIRHDLVPDDIPTVNGYAAIPTKPGLGIEVSDEAIEFYRCDNY